MDEPGGASSSAAGKMTSASSSASCRWLTVEEGECFETGESTDAESEDLDELIYRAENSQHLWLGSEGDDATNDVESLRRKLKQKDEGLNLTAKIGKKLLLITHDLSHKNDHLLNEVHDLRDELNQFKYSQTPRGRSFQLCEEMDNETDVNNNNNDDDDDDVDEGTSCSVGQKIMNNWRLNSSVNQPHNMTTMSSSLEDTISLRRQIDQLNNNNNMLRDEVKMLQQQSQEDFQQLKECYNVEFGNAKKLINKLERRIESGELRFGKFEQEALVWKNSVETLANKCNKHEVEIDVLQDEISKIKTIQSEDKKAMLQLVKENKELRELIDSLRDRVHQMEQTKHPKVLRHVTDSKSPYVDSMSFAQELEKNRTENVNCLLSQQSSSFLCKSSPNIYQISSNPHAPNNFFFKLKRMLGWGHLKLGQPGRPGSNDLDLAVNHLKAIQSTRVNSRRGSKLMSKNIPPNSLKLNHSNKADTRGFDQSVKFHEQNNGDFSSVHVQEVPCMSRNLISPSSTSSSTSHNPDSGYLTTPSSAIKTDHQNFPLFRSRLLQEWMMLGTPDLSKVLRKPSGVWLKGSSVNDFFIEENFSKILSEAENDDDPVTEQDGGGGLRRRSQDSGEPSCSGFNMNFSCMLRDDYNDSSLNKSKFVGISKNICDVSSPNASNKFFITNKPHVDVDTNVNNKTKANSDAVSNYNNKFNELKLNRKENYGTNDMNILPKNTPNKVLHSSYVKIVSKPNDRINNANAVTAVSDVKEHSSTSVENIDSISVFQNNKIISNNRSTSLSDISRALSKSVSNILFASVKNSFAHNVMGTDKTASAQLLDLNNHQIHSPPLPFSKRLSESS